VGKSGGCPGRAPTAGMDPSRPCSACAGSHKYLPSRGTALSFDTTTSWAVQKKRKREKKKRGKKEKKIKKKEKGKKEKEKKEKDKKEKEKKQEQKKEKEKKEK